MPIELITLKNVQDAVKSIRYSLSRLETNPLTNLQLVSNLILKNRQTDNPTSRAFILAVELRDVVWQQVAGQQAPESRGQGKGPEVADILMERLTFGDDVTQEWAALHAQFLCEKPWDQGAIAAVMYPKSYRDKDANGVLGGSAKRMVRKRQKGARSKLVEALQRLESRAEKNRESAPHPDHNTPAQDIDAGYVNVRSPSRYRSTSILTRGTTGELPQRPFRVRTRRGTRPKRSASQPANLPPHATAPSGPLDLIAYQRAIASHRDRHDESFGSRFVNLTLCIDLGEDAPDGRWHDTDSHFTSLSDLLLARTEPAFVVLGPPGSGKSSILRQLQFDVALADAVTPSWPLAFLVELNEYRADNLDEPPPPPDQWLEAQWSRRFPALPGLASIALQHPLIVLLDGLNELSVMNDEEYFQWVQLWKIWMQRFVRSNPRHRVIFSCRELHYSQPLSSKALAVPMVQIEPLTNEQIEAFIRAYEPIRWSEIWTAIQGSDQLELSRNPYYLRLLIGQVNTIHNALQSRSALFTGFVRSVLTGEIANSNKNLAAGVVLSKTDRLRLVNHAWLDAYDLPDDGTLIPLLAKLAYYMQAAKSRGERSHISVSYTEVTGLIGSGDADAILDAGQDLGILVFKLPTREHMFFHQLLQEYFAARVLARHVDATLLQMEWQKGRLRPSLEKTLKSLGPADRLPELPASNWSETALLASPMAESPAAFVQVVMQSNLALAAMCAVQGDVLPRLDPGCLDTLRDALVKRTMTRSADVRDHLRCATLLGQLNDPRLKPFMGASRSVVLPEFKTVAGGDYLIGDDCAFVVDVQEVDDCHVPQHTVTLCAFEIAQHPVTRTEWQQFMDAGGYEDSGARWWTTATGRAWHAGEGTADGMRDGRRYQRANFLKASGILEERFNLGHLSEEAFEDWKKWLSMSENEFETELVSQYPHQRFVEPRLWRDAEFDGPNCPVIGISWYEANAYCEWLSEETGRRYRLPSEIEWEAAVRGFAGRMYPWGNDSRSGACNLADTHIRRTCPVGMFPAGTSPEGIADLYGNVLTWTRSAMGDRHVVERYKYPYDPDDNREKLDVPADVYRVIRGVGWAGDLKDSPSWRRTFLHPANRMSTVGLRLVREAT